MAGDQRSQTQAYEDGMDKAYAQSGLGDDLLDWPGPGVLSLDFVLLDGLGEARFSSLSKCSKIRY
ncbi:MAG: hypothetical protein JSU94_08915 [Phycisphaerales bacterium]|nr:MAG: hypothetical protein JSU94_08915 [Phycisphaerales bacterium]